MFCRMCCIIVVNQCYVTSKKKVKYGGMWD